MWMCGIQPGLIMPVMDGNKHKTSVIKPLLQSHNTSHAVAAQFIN